MKKMTLLFVLLLGTGTVTAAAQPAAEQAVSAAKTETLEQKPVTFSALISVTFDPEVLPLSHEAVRDFFRSRDVVHAAVGKALGERSAEADVIDHLGERVDFVPLGEAVAPGVVLGKLSFEWPALPRPSSDILAALCERLTVVLAHADAQARAPMEAKLRAAMEELHKSLALVDTIQVKRRAMCEAAGMVDMAREHVIAQLSQIETENQRLEFEVRRLWARRQAIEEQIARIAKSADARSDEIAGELERIVAVRQAELERMRALQEQGRVSRTELERCEAQVAEARVELLRQQEELRLAAGGGMLSGLNEALTQLSIELGEREGAWPLVRERAKRLREHGDPLELADRYEREIGLELPMAIERVHAARMRIEAMRRELESRREPAARILGRM